MPGMVQIIVVKKKKGALIVTVIVIVLVAPVASFFLFGFHVFKDLIRLAKVNLDTCNIPKCI